MKNPLIGVAAGALAAFGGAARAEDFTGPRVEATVGWDQTRFDLEDLGLTGTEKNSALGWGLGVGYDMKLSNGLVAGVEANVTFSGADHAATDGTTDYTFDAKRDIELSGRLGTRIGERALLYGKLGYANFRIGEQATTAGVTTAQNLNLDGLRLGAGLEVALSPAAYLKSEYRYTNYEDGVTRNDVLTGIGFRF